MNAFLYGIDIFLSTHAVGANFKIKEVYLGRKIHKPSFDKLFLYFKRWPQQCYLSCQNIKINTIYQD